MMHGTMNIKCSPAFIEPEGSLPVHRNPPLDLVLSQECANPKHHVSQVTKFCMVVPNIFGSSIQNLLHVTAVTPIILQWLVDVWKMCAALS